MKNLTTVVFALLISLTSFSQTKELDFEKNNQIVRELRKAMWASNSIDMELSGDKYTWTIDYNTVSFSDVNGNTIVAEFAGKKYLIKYSSTVTEEVESTDGEETATIVFYYNSHKTLVFSTSEFSDGYKSNTITSKDKSLFFETKE